MRSVCAISVIGCPVRARTLCATTDFFYDVLGRFQDLDLHLLAPEQPLELPNPRIRLTQLAGRDDVFIRGHRRRPTRLELPLPVAHHARRDVELAAQLGERLLAGEDPLDLAPLELRREDSPPVRFPRHVAHVASRRMLRLLGEQSKRGADQ
jgi:hypothetical protein